MPSKEALAALEEMKKRRGPVGGPKPEGDLGATLAAAGVGIGAGIVGTVAAGPLGLVGASLLGGAIGGVADRATYHAMVGDLGEEGTWRDVLKNAGWGAAWGLGGGMVGKALAGRAATKSVERMAASLEPLTDAEKAADLVKRITGVPKFKRADINVEALKKLQEHKLEGAGKAGARMAAEKLLETHKRELAISGLFSEDQAKQLLAEAVMNPKSRAYKSIVSKVAYVGPKRPAIPEIKSAYEEAAAKAIDKYRIEFDKLDELDLSSWGNLKPTHVRSVLQPGSKLMKAYEAEHYKYAAKDWKLGASTLWHKGLQPLVEYLRARPDKFGTWGAWAADSIENLHSTTLKMASQRRALFEPALKEVRNNHKYWEAIMAWGGEGDQTKYLALDAKGRAAVKRFVDTWSTFREMGAEELRRAGVRVVDDETRDILRIMKVGSKDQQRIRKAVIQFFADGGDPRKTRWMKLVQDPIELQKAQKMISELVDKKATMELLGSGGRKQVVPFIPFQARSNYIPVYYNTAKYKALIRKEPKVVNEVMENIKRQVLEHDPKGDVSPEKLTRILKELIEEPDTYLPKDVRAHNIQFSRGLFRLFPDHEMNPDVWVNKYIDDHSRRVAQALVYGGRDEKWDQMITALTGHISGKGGGAASKAAGELKGIFKALTGRREPLPEWAKMLNTGSTVLMLGPRTAGLQLLQLNAPAAFYGYKNLARGLSGLARRNEPAFKRLIEQSGILAPDVIRDWSQDIGRWGEKFLKSPLSGFMVQMDSSMRITSAFSGLFKALDDLDELAGMGARLVRGERKVEKLWRSLKRLGFSDDELTNLGTWYRKGGILNDERATRTMRYASKLTQFETGIGDMPYWRSLKWGPFMYKFHSFSLQQTTMARIMADEAKRGNLAPMLRFAGATGVIGLGTVGPAIQRVLTNPDSSPKERYDVARMVASYGTLGILTDALYAAHMSAKDTRPGYGRLASFAISPNISVGFDIATGAFKVPYELWGVATGATELPEFWEKLRKTHSPNFLRQYTNAVGNIQKALGD